MAGSQAKPSQKAELNTFVQGLITEASPLNFPPNASTAEQNFELNRDGTRDRRRGMDLESPFGFHATPYFPADLEGLGYSTFVWTSPNGDADTEFLIVQVGNQLYVYNNQNDSLSFDGFIANINLTGFPTTATYSFASVDGTLVVVAGGESLFIITYLGGTNFSTTLDRIRVRDVWGIQVTEEDVQYETDDKYRGALTFSNQQIYNLQNQSWGVTRRTMAATFGDPFATTAVITDPLNYFWITHASRYPANSETVYGGLQFQSVGGGDVPSERMYPTLYDDIRGLGVQAAKGYFIIDLLRRGQSRVSESITNKNRFPLITRWLTSSKADYSPGGASIVRGFAGRVFYAGFTGEVIQPDTRSPSLENFVVFSQLVKNTKDITKCYQEGDPTSREGADLVDTDGGFIRIAGAERIVGMRTMGSSLVIFATNGVWEISGGSDYGFGATNYKVTKLSSIGAFSDTSIVEEVGRIFFWGEDGIYAVSTNQFQSNEVKNISQTTIQTLYDNIPSTTKEKAVGVYDLFSKKIRWVYNLGVAFHVDSDMTELVLDTVLGAFYINKIASHMTPAIEIISAFTTPPFQVGTGIEDVLVGSDAVFSGVDLVIVNESVRSSGLQSTRYCALRSVSGGPLNITFSLYNNTSFLDWEKIDGVGVDAFAYVVTGSQIAGDSSVFKQIPYLTMHMRRTENGVDGLGVPINQSGCLMRAQWDFSNSAESRRWSDLKQVYRYNTPHFITDVNYDTGFELITTKNKLRGRGKAFSLYLETEAGKDCRIVGWNLALNGNSIT